jgi:ankyrin repeat protein
MNTLRCAGLTPLGQAVVSQQMAVVKRLVKMGADINAQDGIGRTCLSIAAYQVQVSLHFCLHYFSSCDLRMDSTKV